MTYERVRFVRMLDFKLDAPFVVSLEDETEAWIAEVVNNGGTVSAGRKIVVNDLIIGLKADGIWDKLDRLWLFAAEDDESALTDLVGLTLATAVNSPTFTADEGYTGSATSYIDAAATPSPKYVQNDATWGVWLVSVVETEQHEMVFTGGAINNIFYPWWPSGDLFLWCINTSQQNDAPPPATGGLYAASRYNSSSATMFYNGASLFSDADASSSIAATNWRVAFTTGGNAAFFTGSQLTSGEHSDLYTHLQTYMTAVGL